MVDPVLLAIAHLGLATLFLASAWHKVRDLPGFRAAVARYAVLPPSIVPTAAILFAGAECGLGLGLLLPQTGARASAGAAVLLAIYTIAITLNLVRGRTDIDCGCTGPAGALPVNHGLVIRNAVLVAVSLLAACPSVARDVGVLDVMLVVAATSTFALLYVAAETALANATRWRARSHARASGVTA